MLNALLKIVGLLMVAAGLVLMVLIGTGVLDSWLEENWTCATGSGGSSKRRQCNWLEAEWSALVLSGAIAFGGLLVYLIPAIRSAEKAEQERTVTIDLSRFRRNR